MQAKAEGERDVAWGFHGVVFAERPRSPTTTRGATDASER
jgi:hypothetical protein